MKHALEPAAFVPDLMDEGEAADYLRLSERTLQGWRTKGKGPVFAKQGRRVVYLREDLLQWVRSGRVLPTDDSTTSVKG